jgi:YHS domain-containing protein
MKPWITLLLGLFSITAAFGSDPLVPKLTAAAGIAAREPINSVCPVSGDTVGSVGKPIYGEYQGTPVAFCCKDCARKFRKHPDKYGPLAEKNQTAHEPM